MGGLERWWWWFLKLSQIFFEYLDYIFGYIWTKPYQTKKRMLETFPEWQPERCCLALVDGC